MTRISSLFLLAGLAGLAACDQSGVGGGGTDANTAASGGMESSAEAESDPANTLENQAAALNGAGEPASSTASENASGNESATSAGNDSEAADEGNGQ